MIQFIEWSRCEYIRLYVITNVPLTSVSDRCYAYVWFVLTRLTIQTGPTCRKEILPNVCVNKIGAVGVCVIQVDVEVASVLDLDIGIVLYKSTHYIFVW